MRLLQQQGLDVVQIAVSEQGSPDEWVLQKAIAEARTILTFDRDFGDLIFHHGQLPPVAGIVFFRAKDFTPTEPATWLLRLIESGTQFANYFTTITPELTRQRELPKRL